MVNSLRGYGSWWNLSQGYGKFCLGVMVNSFRGYGSWWSVSQGYGKFCQSVTGYGYVFFP